MRTKSFGVGAAIVLVLSMAQPVTAQDDLHVFVESRPAIQDGHATGQIHLSLESRFHMRRDVPSPLGWYGWALANKQFGVAHVGLTYQAKDWLQVRFGTGMDTGKHERLWAASAILSYDEMPAWATVFYETTRRSDWLQVVGNLDLEGLFNSNPDMLPGFGLMYERGLGFGPRLQIRFTSDSKNYTATFWSAILKTGSEPETFLFGIRLGNNN